MSRPILIAAILAATALPGHAAPETIAVKQIQPDIFVKTVASSNAFEIRSSELAADKAQDPDLKAFASQMIADHTKAAEDLRAAAGDTPVPNDLAPKHAGMIALLEGAEGAEFDMLYTDMQAGAHAEAVTLFATYAAGAPEGGLKAFAMEALPTLEAHKGHIDGIIAEQ